MRPLECWLCEDPNLSQGTLVHTDKGWERGALAGSRLMVDWLDVDFFFMLLRTSSILCYSLIAVVRSATLWKTSSRFK